MTKNGAVITFDYDPNGQRYRQTGSRTTLYLDKLYEGDGSNRHQLYLGDYGVYNLGGPSESAGLKYLHTDRLGSVVAVSDVSGNLEVTAGRHFDPFGKPRADTLEDSAGLNGADLTTRGFTAHEHLNAVELIHMNGRVYDYHLGRFLSVDPVIQFPANSQSLNPYSYLMNNPMAGTDPTGYTCSSDSEIGTRVGPIFSNIIC
ncbi:RHS repeat domain-containing protein [Elongatibacter sediminis]|uniref:RHS repeat-associated core domain-containing protein n=1 Tax=Elongatibacter sediminis TaxID=3119006 RepID=A0AAW9RA58_9GAMM